MIGTFVEPPTPAQETPPVKIGDLIVSEEAAAKSKADALAAADAATKADASAYGAVIDGLTKIGKPVVRPNADGSFVVYSIDPKTGTIATETVAGFDTDVPVAPTPPPA